MNSAIRCAYRKGLSDNISVYPAQEPTITVRVIIYSKLFAGDFLPV
jgi:hypothetical protein